MGQLYLIKKQKSISKWQVQYLVHKNVSPYGPPQMQKVIIQ